MYSIQVATITQVGTAWCWWGLRLNVVMTTAGGGLVFGIVGHENLCLGWGGLVFGNGGNNN